MIGQFNYLSVFEIMTLNPQSIYLETLISNHFCVKVLIVIAFFYQLCSYAAMLCVKLQALAALAALCHLVPPDPRVLVPSNWTMAEMLVSH